MRETFMATDQEAYPEEVQPKQSSFDGWLVAVRAVVFLFAGMVAASLAFVI